MPESPKARVSTAAPRRPAPQQSGRGSQPDAPCSAEAPHRNSQQPQDTLPADHARSVPAAAVLPDQPDHLALTVEQLDAIRELFEVHDFAFAERRKGHTVRSRAAGDRDAALSRAELLDEKRRYGVALKPLKRTPSAYLQLLHDTLFSGTTVDADESQPWKDTLTADDTVGDRLLCEQKLVQDELVRLRQWRQQQRVLVEETSVEHKSIRAAAAPTTTRTQAAGPSRSPAIAVQAPFFPCTVPATAGVSLRYFANFIVGPFFASFFPPAEGETGPTAARRTTLASPTPRMSLTTGFFGQPPLLAPRTSLATNILGDLDKLPEVQQLFRMMDTNADQRVSWDEFSQYVLESGQRGLIDRDQQGTSSSGQGSPAPGAKEGVAESLQYQLGFTPRPTNESVWQTQYPLVHYLFHKEPFTKLLQSHSFPRFVTAGADGLVKLWRTEPRLRDDTGRAVIIHERNLLSLSAPITDMALSTASMGDAELVAATAMDGTVTLLRVATGEMVRTLQGVRTSSATEVSVLNEAIKGRRGVDHEAREWDAQDLLSLRARQPGVSSTVLRQPYTIDAYHHEAVEIFFGQASRYFRGLEVMAPTYEHLKRPTSLTADVLFSFGAEPSAVDLWLTTNAAKPNQRSPPRSHSPPSAATRSGDGHGVDYGHKASRSWFATAVGLALVSSTGGSRRLSAGHYLVLGFENGVLQAFALNRSWFQQSNASAARVEPPSGRRPTFTARPHMSAITHIVVSEVADLLFTASSNGSVEVRSLSRLEAPMLRLGDGTSYSMVNPNAASPTVTTAELSTAVAGLDADTAGHSKRITCMAWCDGERVLVTGGMDYRVFFWSSRSPRPLFRADLREQQRNVAGLNTLGACGYPLDVSFMQHGTEPARVIVLDSKRVIRFLSALNGQLMGFLVDHSPESIALGDVLVARYEAANNRLLLGGRCLRVWNTVKEGAYVEDYYGHRKPVLFMQWHHSLQAMVTADEEHIVMWRLHWDANAQAVARRAQRRLAHATHCERLLEKAEREWLLTRLDGPHIDASEQQTNSIRLDNQAGGHEDGDTADAPLRARRKSSDTRGEPNGAHVDKSGVALPVLYDDLYAALSPTSRSDRAAFNHTYMELHTKIVRTFRVEEGVRSMAMDPYSLTSALFVALLRENAIVQLNVFNGAPLRRFAFAPRAHDIFSLFCGEARMTAAQPRPSPLLCAVYEESAETAVTAFYHVRGEESSQRGPTGSDDSGDTRESQPTSSSTANNGAGVSPYRHVLSRDSLVASVLVLSAMNLVILGGRGQLFMTPVADATSFAVPLRTLVDQASIEDVEMRRSLAIASQHRKLGAPAKTSLTAALASSASLAAATTNPRTSTAVLTSVALFPGRLVSDPAIEETRLTLLYRNAEEQRRRSRLSLKTGVPSTASPTTAVGNRPRTSSATSDGPADLFPASHGSRHSYATSTPFEDASAPPQTRRASGVKRHTESVGNEAAASEKEPSVSGENADKLDALLDKELVRETAAQHGSEAYIGQLCALGATGYVLSANHQGVLQLWNVRTSSEVLRFRVTLTACSVSALCTNVPDGRSSLADSPDPVLVAVGDEFGYVVLLDFSELPWHAEQPLDILPDLEKHVLVVDRWRAHEKDVRSLCFLPSQVAAGAAELPETDGDGERDHTHANTSETLDAPPRCPRTAALHALVAELKTNRVSPGKGRGTRRSARKASIAPQEDWAMKLDDDEEDEDDEDSFYSSSLSSTAPHRSGSASLPKSLTVPLVLASTSEDTYTYVWSWQSGQLNCLGCFGMGPLSPAAPPLREPSYRVPRTFEVARRLYVLRRLVQDKGFFRNVGATAAAASGAGAASQTNNSYTSTAAGAASIVAGTAAPTSFLTPVRATKSAAGVSSERSLASHLSTPREHSLGHGADDNARSGRTDGGSVGRTIGASMTTGAAEAGTAASALLSDDELDDALRFMEAEVHALLRNDPASILCTWGSLSDENALKAADEAASKRTRQGVLNATVAATAAADSKRVPTDALDVAPTGTPSDLSLNQHAMHLLPTRERPRTLFDYAGLDGAYDWMCAADTTTAATAHFEAPPLTPVLPWLRDGELGPHPMDSADASSGTLYTNQNGDSGKVPGVPPFRAFSPLGSVAATTRGGGLGRLCSDNFSFSAVGGAADEPVVPCELSGYVVAFMRGYFADVDARACLRRTVVAMRSTIAKWTRRHAHTAAVPLPRASPPALEHRTGSVTALDKADRMPTAHLAGVRNESMSTDTNSAGWRTRAGSAVHGDETVPALPSPAATTKETVDADTVASPSVGAAPREEPKDESTAAPVLTPPPEAVTNATPARVVFRRSSQRGNSLGAPCQRDGAMPASRAAGRMASDAVGRATVNSPKDNCRDDDEAHTAQRVGRFRIRGPRGEPVYRVGYSDAMPVVRLAADKDAATAEETGSSHLVRLSEGVQAVSERPQAPSDSGPAPPLLAAHYRRLAAAAATDDITTTARDPFEGRGVRMAGSGAAGDVLEDEEALATEDTAFVIHNSYVNHRREEALSHLLQLQQQQAQHEDAAQRNKSVKAAVAIGEAGMATLDEFALTGTTTALFGREQILMDVPVAHKPVLASHLREGLPTHLGGPDRTGSGEGNGGQEEDVDWYTARDRLRRQRQKEEALWNPSRVMLTLMDWDATLTQEERAAQAKRAAAPTSPNPTSPGTAIGSTSATAAAAGEGIPPTSAPLLLPAFLPARMAVAAGRTDAASAAVGVADGASNPTAQTEAEAAPAQTFTSATRDMQQSMAQTRNLNAVVALEVQHLRHIMRESLEEREAFARAEANTAGSMPRPRSAGPLAEGTDTEGDVDSFGGTSPNSRRGRRSPCSPKSTRPHKRHDAPSSPARATRGQPWPSVSHAKVSTLSERRETSTTSLMGAEGGVQRKPSLKTKR